MKFGEKLKNLRQEQGVTQADVAKAIGVTTRSYFCYETQGTYPRKRETYAALAEYFHVDVNYLLTEDEEFVMAASEKHGSRGKKQAEELIAELTGLFAGGEMSESDMDAVMIALQKAYFDCKADNAKYIPKKYRSTT